MSGRKSTDLVGGDHGDKNQELSHGGGGGERNQGDVCLLFPRLMFIMMSHRHHCDITTRA